MFIRYPLISLILEDYKFEVLKDYEIVDGKRIANRKRVNGKDISLKNKLEDQSLRTKAVQSSESITGKSLKISFSKNKVLFFDKYKNRIR